MARSTRRRLKVGGTRFNQYVNDATEANAVAADCIEEITTLWTDNKLTSEQLLALLLQAATAIAQTHVALHECYAIIQETAAQ